VHIAREETLLQDGLPARITDHEFDAAECTLDRHGSSLKSKQTANGNFKLTKK
jgi:hypothetical protein